MSDVVSVMAANLAATMRKFAQILPNGCVAERAGVVLVDAGAALPMFNAAVQVAPAETVEDFDRQIAAAADFYRQRAVPWCFWACDGMLAIPPRRAAARVMEAAGLAPAATNTGLFANELHPPCRPLPDLRVRPIHSSADRQSFCHIMTMAFEGPAPQISAVYGSHDLWRDGFQGFIGSIQGQDVSAGATVTACGATGIYAVGTLPGFTGRGYGEALTRAAISLAGAGQPPLPFVLQSTPEALRLYRRLGFQQVTSFTVYTHD